MKKIILLTVLIFITTLTTSIAQNKKPYNILMNDEVFTRPGDRDLDRVKEAKTSIEGSIVPIFSEIMKNCTEFDIVDIKIRNDWEHAHDEIGEGRLKDGKLGFGQAKIDSLGVDFIIMSYIKYERRTDQNSLSLKFVLVDKNFILKTVERDFFKLSQFNPDNNKEAKETKKILTKMLKQLLDFKQLKNREGYNEITKRCICSRTKTQRFFGKNLTPSAGSLVGGLLLTTYGINRVRKANEQYIYYDDHRYPNDTFYLQMNITRDEYLDDTQSKNRIGYASLGTGLLFTVVGTLGIKIHFDCKEGKLPYYSDATLYKKRPPKSLKISPLLDYDPITTSLNSQIKLTYQF